MVAKSKRPPPMLDMDEEPETSSLPIGEAFLGNTNESSDKAALHSSDPDQDGSAAPVDKDSYQNFVTPIVWGAAEHRSEIQPAKTVSGTHGFLGDDNEELVDSSCVPGTVEVEETSIATLPYSDAVRQNCEDEESAALSARRSPNGSSAEDMHEPSVKHPTPAYRKRALQMRTMALAVEVNEGTGEDASYSSLAGTGGGHATSCSRRTASLQVDQLLKGLPLATVLMINRLVVKFQAHIRGVLARRNAWRLRKRSTRLDQLGAPSSAAWPASDEIATFCEATQITEDSCRGNKVCLFVPVSVLVSMSVSVSVSVSFPASISACQHLLLTLHLPRADSCRRRQGFSVTQQRSRAGGDKGRAARGGAWCEGEDESAALAYQRHMRGLFAAARTGQDGPIGTGALCVPGLWAR